MLQRHVREGRMRYDRADIRDAFPSAPLFARLLGLRIGYESGDRCRVICPWHEERQAACSMRGSGETLSAHCFACQAGGDGFSLAMQVWGCSFADALPRLGELLGVAMRAPPDSAPPRRPSRDIADEYVAAMDEAVIRFMSGRDTIRSLNRARAHMVRMDARTIERTARRLWETSPMRQIEAPRGAQGTRA